MATLSIEEVKSIILNNPNKDLVNKAKRINKELRMHMYGEKLSVNMPIIDGVEQEMLHELRVKYAKSNKDLFARLGRYLDQIFSANGGSTYFNLNNSYDKKASIAVGNARDGMSSKRWTENYWKPHYLDDPNGMVFMEIGNGSNYPVGKVYPTYKGISTVYDYAPKGSMLDYVVFEVSDSEKRAYGLKVEDKIYRVVDDAFDYYVKVVHNDIEVLEDHTYPNYFMFVPAMLNSDIIDPNVDGCMLSIYDEVIELANQYLLKGSIKITHEFLHGFPKYWEYADDCGKCFGTGNFNGETCPECHGSKKSPMVKVNRAKLLSYPESKDAPMITPNVAGYVSPDKTFHEIATADISMLESAMHFTLWRTHDSPKTQGMQNDGEKMKTATEIVDDKQPIAARLTKISESASKRIKFINDCIISVELRVANYREQGGSSVSLGTRFTLESPDAVWQRYVDAKTAKAPISVLNDLLMDFIDTKYKDDPIGLQIAVKLMNIEPFVHNTIQEVQGLNADPLDYACKLYFGEWLSRKNDAFLFGKDEEALRQDLEEYAGKKELPEPVEEKPTPIGFGK